MEKTILVSVAKLRFWLVVSAAFLLWYVLISMYNSEYTPRRFSVSVVTAGQANSVLLPNEGSAVIDHRNVSGNENEVALPDPCSGRYIYVHDLPAKFNDDMLRDCRSLSNWTDMCESMSNYGFGPPLPKAEWVYTSEGWFATNQFALEVIFHNRMKRYECLTNDSSSASAVFVPFYAGLDVARFLWGRHNTTVRDSASLELVRWLREKPEWRRLHGWDHFLIAGRITWDFRRLSNEESDWGNKFLFLPETENMTVLTIESSPWGENDVAVPYPTYFHPSESAEMAAWQGRIRLQRRRFLFSFAGAPRPNMPDSIRGEIIDQCLASRGRMRCKLLKCDSGGSKCHAPAVVMQMFQSSVFCLQPPGDSTTRRSAFDSILAGCVPVFFHPGSAYLQYTWHLPPDHTKYSVFIPESGLKNGTVSIGETLGGIPEERVAAMREEVVRLIPSVIYARQKLEGVEDAFDISVKAVLQRVDNFRKAMKEGSAHSKLSGNGSEHAWDHY